MTRTIIDCDPARDAWRVPGSRPSGVASLADWPHALRDRLGLGHYGGGAELPVALMRYSLADVFLAQASRQLSVACALPTVLDGGMHQFFFPVPREHPYGATVHLLFGAGGHPDCRDCPLPDRLSAHASVPAGDDHATTSIDRRPTARRPRPAPSRVASRVRPH